MIAPTTGIVALARWLEAIDNLAIRSVEYSQPYFIKGKKARRLRGIMLAPDLCLGRNKIFYKILDKTHAAILPTFLVPQQYNVSALIKKFNKARPRRGADVRKQVRDKLRKAV